MLLGVHAHTEGKLHANVERVKEFLNEPAVRNGLIRIAQEIITKVLRPASRKRSQDGFLAEKESQKAGNVYVVMG
jgi:hypothetical protein